jgi:hypothetical protein
MASKREISRNFNDSLLPSLEHRLTFPLSPKAFRRTKRRRHTKRAPAPNHQSPPSHLVIDKPPFVACLTVEVSLGAVRHTGWALSVQQGRISSPDPFVRLVDWGVSRH